MGGAHPNVAKALRGCLDRYVIAIQERDTAVRSAVELLRSVAADSVPDELKDDIAWIVGQPLNKSSDYDIVVERIAYVLHVGGMGALDSSN